MKILLINKFLYPKGGDAICTLATGELLDKNGHQAIFWGMKHPSNPTYPYSDFFVDNLDLNNAGGIKNQIDVASKMLYSIEAKQKIEKLFGITGKPDLIHLHNFAHQISPSILDVFKKHGIPVVMTMHDYKLVCAAYALMAHGKLCEACAGGRHWNCFRVGCVKDSKAKSFLNTVEMILHHQILGIYKNIAIFISPSNFLKEKLYVMGFKGRIEVLPNFIDATEYAPRYGVEERSISFIGRLSKEKGVATLISAVKGLDVELKIIGDGPMKAQLEAFVSEQGISNVRFLGYCSGDTLKEEMRNSMFMVIPSLWYENNPRSVIEAFALGKPVIGARIGGIPELIKDDDTGFLFEPGNVNDLRSKIEYLSKDPDKISKIGKNARVFVEKELNPDKHYEELMRIYKEAMNR